MSFTKKTEYWVWLTSKKHINNEKIVLLLECFGSISKIYSAENYDAVPGIRQVEIDELMDKGLEKAERIIEKTQELGGRVVTVDDKEYPPALREIYPAPSVLYMKGEHINWEEQLAIAVIGTRQCSDYGRMVTEKISYEMAAAGILVVSGMARGLDSVAAISALRAGGKTVAVLGSGLDVVYPPENEILMRAICDNGVVMTEYPPSTRPERYNFPQRNRIISGLSRGLLEVEAGRKSGTFSTVSYARDYKRDVFAVPGGIFYENSQGTNQLIKDGAYLVTSAKDIMENYPCELPFIKPATGEPVFLKDYEYNPGNEDNIQQEMAGEKRPDISVDDERYSGLNADEKKIIELLINKEMHIDELVRESGISIRTLNAILPVLEMVGHIKKITGNIYKLDI